jgi:CysZ protein
MNPGPRPLPVASPPASGVSGMGAGFSAFMAGLKLVAPGGGLFKYAIAPIIISAIVLGGLIVGTFFLAQALLGAWLADVDLAWLRWVGSGLAVLLALVLSYFLFSPVMTLFGPLFMDPICERVHVYYTGQPLHAEEHGRSLVVRQFRALVQSLKWAAISLFIEIPLVVIAALTVVGFIVAAAVSSVIRGVDLMDYPLSLRQLTLSQKLRWSRQRPWPMMGLGAAASISLLIPVLNLFVIPAGAAGATILMIAQGVSPDDRK